MRPLLASLLALVLLAMPALAHAADASSNCSLGIVNPNWDVSREFSAFSVFLYADPAQCTACPAPRAVQVTQVRIPFCGANNNLQFTVTAVAAVNTAGTLVPDPSQPLGPSQTFTNILNCPGGFLSARAIILPTPVPIDRPCFLRIKVKDLGSPAGLVPITGFGVYTCHPSYSFVSWPEGAPILDACTVFGGDAPMWMTATCDAVVGVSGHTWGALKIRYR